MAAFTIIRALVESGRVKLPVSFPGLIRIPVPVVMILMASPYMRLRVMAAVWIYSITARAMFRFSIIIILVTISVIITMGFAGVVAASLGRLPIVAAMTLLIGQYRQSNECGKRYGQ